MNDDKQPTLPPYSFDELHAVLGHVERGTYTHEMVRRLAHTALSALEVWYTVDLGDGHFIIQPDGQTLRLQSLTEAQAAASRFRSAARDFGSTDILIYKGDTVVERVPVME